MQSGMRWQKYATYFRYVILIFFYNHILIFPQIPSDFQQLLSGQRQPCLADYIPAFQGMLDSLKLLLNDPHYADARAAIQAGISKAEEYALRAHFTEVPVYTLATSKHVTHNSSIASDFFSSP